MLVVAMKINAAAKKILHKLEKSGFEAYIVGGAVRDFLLQRPIRDIDICTNATVEQLKKIFPKHSDIGGDHGTLLVHMNGEHFEVSEFKGDSKTNEKTLLTDLMYRDFSCNAMAMKADGTIIDPFGGQETIKNKTIRVVNDDPNRLLDDPLRLLRGIRLAIELNFQIDRNTEKWMNQYASLIQQPAKERIAQEFEKLFENIISKNHLHYLLTHKVVTEIELLFPERSQLLHGLEKLPATFSVIGKEIFWLIASFTNKEEKTKEILKIYKRSRKMVKFVTNVVEYVLLFQKQGEFNDLHLYRLQENGIKGACTLLSLLKGKEINSFLYEQRYRQLPIHNREQLAISGSDLITWFPNKQGKWIGSTIQTVEEEVVLKKLANEKQHIYDRIIRELV